jgi:hypothetical protein
MKHETIKLESGYKLTVKGIQIKETYPDILVQIPVILTTQFQFKVTTQFQFKLTT